MPLLNEDLEYDLLVLKSHKQLQFLHAGTILLCVRTLNRWAYCLQEVVEYSCTGSGVSDEVMLIQVEITHFEWIDSLSQGVVQAMKPFRDRTLVALDKLKMMTT
jgi:hypothetical protein